jgi:hypothetical protein
LVMARPSGGPSACGAVPAARNIACGAGAEQSEAWDQSRGGLMDEGHGGWTVDGLDPLSTTIRRILQAFRRSGQSA